MDGHRPELSSRELRRHLLLVEGGLIWGTLVLLFALFLLVVLIPDIRAATHELPELSPATVRDFELDPFHQHSVEVRGFEPACEQAHFDGAGLLIPARSASGDALILIAVDYGSECAGLGSSFRGTARLWEPRSRAELDARERLHLDELDHAIPVVRRRTFPASMFASALGLAALGLLGIASAFVRRRRALERLAAQLAPRVEPVAPKLDDPYRPNRDDRLIPEALRPSPEHLARLRRARTLRMGVGAVLLGAAALFVLVGGWQIAAHEWTWSRGVEPVQVRSGGTTERVGPGIVQTRVDVAYVDSRGRHHCERVTTTSLISRPDRSVTPKVRYLPDHPDRFAVSWVHEQVYGSLILLTLTVIGLCLAGGAAVSSARRDRASEHTLAVFDDPREALLELHDVETASDGESRTYNFRVRDSARRWSVHVGRGQPAPLFLDAREVVALALYSPEARDFLVVLSEDLRELDRPEFSAAQLRGRYRESVGAVPRPRRPRR